MTFESTSGVFRQALSRAPRDRLARIKFLAVESLVGERTSTNQIDVNVGLGSS